MTSAVTRNETDDNWQNHTRITALFVCMCSRTQFSLCIEIWTSWCEVNTFVARNKRKFMNINNKNMMNKETIHSTMSFEFLFCMSIQMHRTFFFAFCLCFVEQQTQKKKRISRWNRFLSQQKVRQKCGKKRHNEIIAETIRADFHFV